MSITSIFTALGLVWKIWPIVRDVIPKILTAVEHVAKTFSPPKPVKDMDEAEKIVWDNARKLHVQIAVREFVGKDVITDSQLNWAIETVLQIKSFFPNKK